ncbi:hypothetical protein FOA52_003082 [Chlamydomonas sp. UWO 241]|nr:hypothetical protein FOA52_003082 [Chlamydomonas sp. UWO 241]
MTIDPSAPGARAHLGNLADVAATLRPTGASSYNDNITANTLRQQQANRDSRTYGTFEGEHKLRQAAAPVDPGCVLRFEPDSFNGTIMSFTRRLEVAMDALRKGKGGLVPGLSQPGIAKVSADADDVLRASAAAAGLPVGFSASGSLNQELLTTVKKFMAALNEGIPSDATQTRRAKPEAGHDYALLQLPAALQKAAGCSDPRCSSCDEVFEAAMRTSKCSLCSLRYCSAACQARSWPVHKPVCKGKAAAWAATEGDADHTELPRSDLTEAELQALVEGEALAPQAP